MQSKGMVLLAPLLLVGVLAGCWDKTPAQKAAEDARDVAMVERMSKEPFRPIIPKPVTSADVTRYGLDRPGCMFRKGDERDPLFIADSEEGFMRIGGDLKRFAAKKESAQLPGNARTTYVGLSSWIDLVRQPDAAAGGDQDRWPARMIIHDAQERVAFMADGMVTCIG